MFKPDPIGGALDKLELDNGNYADLLTKVNEIVDAYNELEVRYKAHFHYTEFDDVEHASSIPHPLPEV